jgi:hypothetical protein
MASRLESRRNRKEIQWGGEEENLKWGVETPYQWLGFVDKQCLEERLAKSSKVNFFYTTTIRVDSQIRLL